MATSDACLATSARMGCVSPLNGPWLVCTTGGLRMPRRPAMSGPRKVWSWMTSTSASDS